MRRIFWLILCALALIAMLFFFMDTVPQPADPGPRVEYGSPPQLAAPQ